MWTMLWLFNFGNVVSIILILWIALRSPYLSRRDVFFSVTVRPEFPESPEGVEVFRQFRRTLLLYSGLAIVIIAAGNWQFLASKNRDAAFFVTMVVPSIFAVGLQVAAFIMAHLKARRLVLPHGSEPSSIREVSLVSESEPKGGKALAFFRLGPWLILALSALYLQGNWERIPDRFPTHWGATGQVDGWASRSFYGVFGPLLMGAATLLLFEAIMFLITIGMPRVVATKGARTKEML